jgi:asparagine synthase (glutamine-hydrolysing)
MQISVRADWSPSDVARVVLRDAVRWKHLSVVADARIDNQLELQSALGSEPGSTVGELVARAYLTWGDEFPERLSGDFALVIWDSRERRIVAARDPFGVKPLSYRFGAEGIWLESHVRSLLATFARPPDLDDERILEYLLGRFRSCEATFFRDVRDVPAGHVIVATSSGVVRHRYWDPPVSEAENGTHDRREYYDEFRRLFVNAVRRRTRSSGPVLVHVSGGLDSSAIACAVDVVMRDGTLGTPAVEGVSATYPGLSCDESEFVELVARRIGFPIRRWDGLESDDSDLTDPRVDQPGLRAPFMGGTRGDVDLARARGSSVILAGTGGDQLGMVSGYVKDLIAEGQWAAAMREIAFFPGATMTSRYGRAKTVLGQSLPGSLLERFAGITTPEPVWLTAEHRESAKDLLTGRPRGHSSLRYVPRAVWTRLTSAQTARSVSFLNASAEVDGVEYRFPFLDKDLIHYTLTIPVKAWPRPGPYARLHRDALDGLLPPEITRRSAKAEFTPALVHRVMRARRLIDNLMSDGIWASSPYVILAEARRLWLSASASGDGGRRLRSASWCDLWAIATLEVWLRRILGYPLPAVQVQKEALS